MQCNEYQQLAKRTANETLITNFLLGLAGEAGEVVDYMKKVLYHGHLLDLDKLSKELGDVLWYISQIALYYDLELNKVALDNIEKLKARYPKGFSTERSINRAE